MTATRLPITREQLADFCQRHHIQRLAFFGSVVRDDFGPDSDVDVLVEFDPDHIPGWDIVTIEDEFSRLIGGRPVQFVNPKYLNHRLEEQVLSEAQVQYVEG